MGKEVTSVSLDGDLKEWFQENYPEVSLSSIVEQVIREMQETGRRPDGIKFKREMLEREIEQHESQLERARKQLERIEEAEEEQQSVEEEAEERAIEFAEKRNSHVTPENPGVQNQAAKCGVPPDEFAELVNEHIDPSDGLRTTA